MHATSQQTERAVHVGPGQSGQRDDLDRPFAVRPQDERVAALLTHVHEHHGALPSVLPQRVDRRRQQKALQAGEAADPAQQFVPVPVAGIGVEFGPQPHELGMQLGRPVPQLPQITGRQGASLQEAARQLQQFHSSFRPAQLNSRGSSGSRQSLDAADLGEPAGVGQPVRGESGQEGDGALVGGQRGPGVAQGRLHGAQFVQARDAYVDRSGTGRGLGEDVACQAPLRAVTSVGQVSQGDAQVHQAIAAFLMIA